VSSIDEHEQAAAHAAQLRDAAADDDDRFRFDQAHMSHITAARHLRRVPGHREAERVAASNARMMGDTRDHRGIVEHPTAFEMLKLEAKESLPAQHLLDAATAHRIAMHLERRAAELGEQGHQLLSGRQERE
jgi:hypothetical protein